MLCVAGEAFGSESSLLFVSVVMSFPSLKVEEEVSPTEAIGWDWDDVVESADELRDSLGVGSLDCSGKFNTAPVAFLFKAAKPEPCTLVLGS